GQCPSLRVRDPLSRGDVEHRSWASIPHGPSSRLGLGCLALAGPPTRHLRVHPGEPDAAPGPRSQRNFQRDRRRAAPGRGQHDAALPVARLDGHRHHGQLPHCIPEQPGHGQSMTYLLILLTTVCTIVGQLILKRAGTGLRPLLASGPVEFLFGAATSPLVIAALGLQVVGYVAWLFVLSREKLSVAFALSGSTLYLLTAIASWYFFGERLTGWQWLGFVLIS